MDAATSQLEKLKTQQTKIAARIQLMVAREKTSERKKETRRKILVGAYYLDQAALNNQFDAVKKLLDGYLKRNSDRKLFNLPALEEEKASMV